MSSVSKEIFSGIIYCTEASAVWTDLKERFDKICGSRIFSLHREISHLSQGSSSISMYFSNLKKLWDEYSSLVTLPSCGCATAKAYLDHDQHQRLLQFLMGLNEMYGHVRSQILMLDPLPSVNQAYSIISQEESHRVALSSHPSADLPSVAFYSSSNKKVESVKCENCNVIGHTKDQCFRIIGYPPGHKLHKKFPQSKNYKFTQKPSRFSAHNSVNTTSDSFIISEESKIAAPSVAHALTDAQYQQLLKLLDQPLLSPEATINLAGTFTSLMTVSKDTDWILDTGANADITGTSSVLQSTQPCASSPGSVRLPNGPFDWEDHGDW
ncbi:uncharacterized protein LOC142552274 [Primulina tabacum]|uniref:uncharacterized protein LOC142552274 n=1 Tax=Primulina tabacum TaxID=48773 RepID=UPI003F5A9BB2